MKYLVSALCIVMLCSASTFSLAGRAPSPAFPAPSTISPAMQQLVEAPPPAYWNDHPASAQEWKRLAASLSAGKSEALAHLRSKLGVTLTKGEMRGVAVFTLAPPDSRELPQGDSQRVLLHLHGGGYVLGAGEMGTQEATLMAAMGKFRVVSVDYRVAPDFPYPAAMDDAMQVYRHLLKTTPAEKIGVFGSSTGGAMSLILALRAKEEGLPLPGAIGAGTPWADLSKTGDSYYTNEGVDSSLVSYDGWVGSAAKLYAGGHDLKDPMLSPVYGDVKGFPPTMLTTGTRDLFLSNTVRMHMKLREAGVVADLMVFEGQSHIYYHVLEDAPETKFHFEELGRFFRRWLQ